MRTLIIALLLAGICVSTAISNPYPKVQSYELNVAFHPETSSLEGYAAVVFEPSETLADSIIFALHGELAVDSVRAGGIILSHSQEKVFYPSDCSLIANRTAVSVPSTGISDALEVFYRGRFNLSQARSESDYMRIDPTGVYLRSYYYSLWFPIFLQAGQDGYSVDFTDVMLEVPEEFVAVFTGRQVSDTVVDGIRQSRWQAQDAYLYQAQCTARPFEHRTLGSVHVYCLPDSASIAGADSILAFVQNVTEEFAIRYSPQAEANEFHIMEMPEYGNISSGNVVGFTSDLWLTFSEEIFPKRTMAHELVHAFVQPPIKREDNLAALMVEGFPSYFHLPVVGEMLSEGWYDDYIIDVQEAYLAKRATGLDHRDNPLPPEKPIDQLTFEDISEYKDRFVLNDRVRLFLDYLRRQMGRDRFDTYCQALFATPALDGARFLEVTAEYLPGSQEDVTLWLSTTEYPERFRIQ